MREAFFRTGSASDCSAFPLLGTSSQGLNLIRPVVQSRGIEVRAIRPDQRLHFGINPYLIEEREITQRLIQFPSQDGMEIDRLLRAVIKPHPQGMGGHDLKRHDTVNGMN